MDQGNGERIATDREFLMSRRLFPVCVHSHTEVRGHAGVPFFRRLSTLIFRDRVSHFYRELAVLLSQ